MDLSIIVPCHNLEKFITPLLVSLKLQVLENEEVELIFICDHCTDNTYKIINEFEFGKRFKRILVGECDVCACGLARNVGLEQSQGKYILFLDGDDWLTDPFALYKIISFFRDNPQYEVFRFAYEAPGFRHIGHPAMVWQYAYSRNIIGNTRFLQVQPDEDLLFNQEIIKKLNYTIPFCSQKFYHYNYMREGSNVQQLTTKGRIIP